MLLSIVCRGARCVSRSYFALISFLETTHKYASKSVYCTRSVPISLTAGFGINRPQIRIHRGQKCPQFTGIKVIVLILEIH